ncbi:transmembrane 4 L6 family member 19 [Pseudophryne corroboree]|uniref:transmembrane 4 L6 family member 19 n=1 Tax=Pseudophryne corroboree TaxID=495146 RepID=UPI0030819181
MCRKLLSGRAFILCTWLDILCKALQNMCALFKYVVINDCCMYSSYFQSYASEDMCVERCARSIGLCLVFLALLSIAANLFLLYPNLDGLYLRKNQISEYAGSVRGVWAGGLLVLLAGIQITVAGFRVKRLSCCGPRCDMLLSGIFSSVAMVGAAISLLTSVAGLFHGPYCLYTVNDGTREKWGYPFRSTDSNINSSISTSGMSSICIEPPSILTWNSAFFLSLSLINMLQIVLCLSQFLNACLGVVCGQCEQKK